MERTIAALIGVKGHATGEVFLLHEGRTYIVGRSRSADISFRKLADYRAASREDRESDGHFTTVSGKHFSVQVDDLDHVIIRNLSRNGTSVDGERLDGEIEITDLREREHSIRFGSQELWVLRTRSIRDDGADATGDTSP